MVICGGVPIPAVATKKRLDNGIRTLAMLVLYRLSICSSSDLRRHLNNLSGRRRECRGKCIAGTLDSPQKRVGYTCEGRPSGESGPPWENL